MGDTVPHAVVSEYIVTGMVCQHCVSSVAQELGAIEGVTDARVDLVTGRATVTSDGPLDPAAVRAAIEEAGYEISG